MYLQVLLAKLFGTRRGVATFGGPIATPLGSFSVAAIQESMYGIGSQQVVDQLYTGKRVINRQACHWSIHMLGVWEPTTSSS